MRFLMDASGAITDRYDFDAFGVALSTIGGSVNSYRYLGEHEDDRLGLVYLRARYFDANTGRMTSPDPFLGVESEPASLWRYAYAAADPINKFDPSGRDVPQLVGMAVHDAIGEDFAATGSFARATRYYNRTLGVIAAMRAFGGGGALQFMHWALRPDLIDVTNTSLWEVKPSSSAAEGRVQLAAYLLLLNQFGMEDDVINPAGSTSWKTGDSTLYVPPAGYVGSPCSVEVNDEGGGLITYTTVCDRDESEKIRRKTDVQLDAVGAAGLSVGAVLAIVNGARIAVAGARIATAISDLAAVLISAFSPAAAAMP